MNGTRLPDKRAQAVRSLGSPLNYVRLDPRKGLLELVNSLTALAAEAFMVSCNDRNALTRIPNKIYQNPGPQGKLGFPDFPPSTKIDSVNFDSHSLALAGGGVRITKDKIAVRNNAGKTTTAATVPMANTYENPVVLEKIENLAATFRHKKCYETSSV
ncbi:hypothetical protein DY000_02014834 [Brassica cretica]|uniref:Uncharacterized protein n=1 Tax=Brassica cretica TaxID=69181 RepID=A0ABQ7CXY4_BRACR|nr:hypothetical protein DY000_02014834 [Brassica cretica]